MMRLGVNIDHVATIRQARRAAERSASVIRDVVDAPAADARVGESFALAGTIYNFIGEHYYKEKIWLK